MPDFISELVGIEMEPNMRGTYQLMCHHSAIDDISIWAVPTLDDRHTAGYMP